MNNKKLADEISATIDNALNEASINAKKRNVNNLISAMKTGRFGYNAIQTIGILTAENPNTVKLDKHANYKRNKSLYSMLKDSRYLVIKAKGYFGDNPEHSYAVINISTDALALYAGRFEQESFIYHVIQPDGTMHSEYWEKQFPKVPYDARTNPYIKADESDVWVDCEQNDTNFTMIDNKFKYSVVFPIFIEDTINENIQNMIKQNRLIDTPTDINEYIEFSYKNCGFGGYAQRCKIYHNCFKLLN